MRALDPPPYGVAPVRFPFPALAALAARSPLGGAREVAIACLMAARLAAALPVSADLDAGPRSERVASARAWFAAIAVPAPLRAALVRLANAATRGTRAEAAGALAGVLGMARRQLDAASIAELEHVLGDLRRDAAP